MTATPVQTHPYEITAPATMTMKANTSGQFTIVNTGTKPIIVHESLGRYSPYAIQYPAADHATRTTMSHPWLTVNGPSSFTLAPHAARTVHVSSHVPAGAQGNHYLNILWTATPVRAVSGPLHLSGAVASNVIIPLPGIAQPVSSATSLPAGHLAPHHGGIGAVDLAGAGLAAALIASVATLVIRRRRRNRRAARRAEVAA